MENTTGQPRSRYEWLWFAREFRVGGFKHRICRESPIYFFQHPSWLFSFMVVFGMGVSGADIFQRRDVRFGAQKLSETDNATE